MKASEDASGAQEAGPGQDAGSGAGTGTGSGAGTVAGTEAGTGSTSGAGKRAGSGTGLAQQDLDTSRIQPQPGLVSPPETQVHQEPLTPARRLRRLLRLQVYYGFFATLHWILVYFFLIEEMSAPVPFVLALAMFIYTLAAFVMLVVPAMEYRWTLRIGFLFRIVAILPFWLWPTPEGVFLGAVFFALAQPLFWVPYNLIFFEHRARSMNAGTSAIAFAVQPVLDVVAAALAGLLVLQYGFSGLFLACFILGVVGWPGTMRLNPRSAVRVEIWKRLSRLKRLRTMIFLDGVSQGIVWVGVAVITIVFVQSAVGYAAFFAVLGIVGAAASLILGRMSDKSAKRFAFIWPVAVAFAAANVVSAFAASVWVWGAARGFATFFGLVFDPFKNAVYLDVATTVEDLYMGRELLLHSGRVVGILVLMLSFWAGDIQASLIVAGAIAITIPVLIMMGDLYPHERIVLKPLRMMWRQ